MARRNGVWVAALVLGVLAVFFGLLAYATRIKVEYIGPVCAYQNSPASALSVVAMLCLLGSQIIITVATNCFCCGGARRVSQCITIFFILSWITCVIAFGGLIYTAIYNSGRYLAKQSGKKGHCLHGEENVFLGAAILSLITFILSLISYSFLMMCGSQGDVRNAHLQGTTNHAQGVSMGQPHIQQRK